MAEKTKSAKIASQLEQMILNKEFDAGENLPSQQELAEKFGVSPRAVREAFNTLEVKGLVTIVQGKKTVVNETSLDRFIESLSFSMLNEMEVDRTLLMNLFQVTITIETEAARGLSRDPNRKKVVSQMNKVVDEMRAILADTPNASSFGKEVQDCEQAFHKAIITTYDNQILSSIYESLSPLLYKYLRMLTYTREELEKEIDELEYLAEGFANGTTDLVVALTLVILNGTKSKCEMLGI
ncbi:MAG: FadR/GntR family transcriptional regulator [Sphaerochaetaceae bacterium]